MDSDGHFSEHVSRINIY